LSDKWLGLTQHHSDHAAVIPQCRLRGLLRPIAAEHIRWSRCMGQLAAA